MSNRIYGIDLGTTNSAIALDDKLITQLVPSIADIKSGRAGESLLEEFSSTRSFKVNMSCGEEGKEPVAASALVLREMVRICREQGHEVKDVVISVPAYFSTNQRSATKKAAENIGLNVRALVNEPTAAAVKYCSEQQSLIMVFDLGGGTFDISVIDSRAGSFDVIDTRGEVKGGDDFDRAIARKFVAMCGIKLHRMDSNELNQFFYTCRKAKEKLQSGECSVEVDLSFLGLKTDVQKVELTVELYTKVMKDTFQSCMNMTRRLMEKCIDSFEEFNLVFVGGSTRCPHLRAWVEYELGVKATEQEFNPDTIVAIGAAYYAKMIEDDVLIERISDVTKAIGVRKVNGTMEVIIPAGSKLPISDCTLFTNPVNAKGLVLDVYQGDSVLAENNEFIGKLNYEFGREREANSANVEVSLTVDMNGIVEVEASEVGREPVKVVLVL